MIGWTEDAKRAFYGSEAGGVKRARIAACLGLGAGITLLSHGARNSK